MAYLRHDALEIAKDCPFIAITFGSFGSHLGVAFQSAKDGVQVLHLAGHCDLRTDTFPPPGQCWIAAPVLLPPLAAKTIVGIIRSMAKRTPKIPYGLNFLRANGSFDSSGRYKAPKGSLGLTCATFITTLFDDLRAPLVKQDTWLAKTANIKWAHDVCDSLTNSGKVSLDHIEAVKLNIDGLRIRPEEVAVAAEVPFKARPIDYLNASSNAHLVMQSLISVCPVPARISQAVMEAAQPADHGVTTNSIISDTPEEQQPNFAINVSQERESKPGSSSEQN